MGVHGLWPLLHPVARPVALETMGGKKLAIDSSIWLYQFQIAMRDKDGRALDNAHILGFLRRICKLLFYGIKPVFVFDGGAPLIKKVAISNRKNKKQGAKETAAKTAEKLLAAQLRAAAVKQAQKDAIEKETGDIIGPNAVYMDEDYGIAPRGAPTRRNAQSSPAAAVGAGAEDSSLPKKKKYVHKDQYALPVVEGPLSARAGPSDPRLATEAELRSFVEEMRPEDFDVDSEFFANLPTEAKYEIIGDLRVKSRQSNYRRVEAMKNAPTPLDFSRAQILGLSHRNNLTQKLLAVTDSLSRVMPLSGPSRIAGERNKEYVLIKNDSSEGTGYILGVRDNAGKTASSPVKIEATTTEESDIDKTTTDEEFEQVQIPANGRGHSASPELAEQRRERAKEAILQRYSPVKPTHRRGDSPIDDLPALPPQNPLFAQKDMRAAPQRKGDNEQSLQDFVPDYALWDQIESALQQADANDVRMGEDEREDLQRAIEASKKEMASQAAPPKQLGAQRFQNNDDGDDSDVSFDEVNPDDAKTSVPEISNSTHAVPQQQTATIDSDEESIEYVEVPPVASSSGKVTRTDRSTTRGQEPLKSAAAKPVSSEIPSRVAQRKMPNKPTIAQQSTTAGQSAPSQLGHVNGTSSSLQSIPPAASSLQAKTAPAEKPRKKSVGLHIDIPAAAYKPPTEEETRVPTPRPDLTEKQALRNISPQKVTEENGVVQRDYAPQPSASPAPPYARTSPSESRNQTLSGSSKRPSSPAMLAAPRPSLMARTLSTQSGEISPVEPFNSSGLGSVVPNGSTADEAAVTSGTMSILDEVKQTLPDVGEDDDGIDKIDLQTAVQGGNVKETLASTQQHHNGGNVSSPEVFYEGWSPSPEAESASASRKQSMTADATQLAPDDPNYIPPDIDFPDAGHELSDLDEEEREQLQSLTSEQAEYAKFLSELKQRNLDEMEYEVQNELTTLREQDKRDKKMADDITQQMAKDIQQLLKVLGLPYVVAPMEAEAQCAELLSRTLVDGVITDDNDVFLFGATKVYKNMFNQNKYVECYLATDIDRELALDRSKLIRLAQFLGSDYCDGLPGVGPVLGMELMAEFPGKNGLVEFREWWLKVQRGRDSAADHPTAFRRKFKKSKRELFLDEAWPNPEVAKAYLNPQVDDSNDPFYWGIPDLDALRDFLRENLGWGHAKTDELMLPIIRKLTGRAAGGAVNQAVISNFFDISGGTGRFAPMSNKGYQSKRLQNVVKAWRQSQQQLAKQEGSGEEESEEEEEDEAIAESQPNKKTRGRVARPSTSRRGSSNTKSQQQATSSKSSSARKSSSRRSSQFENSDDSDAGFNEELEAQLASMGVKRKRETAVGSSRVVKPAKRSKRNLRGGRGGKTTRPSLSRNGSSQDPATAPLFAADSEDEEKTQAQPTAASGSSRSKKASNKKSKTALLDDSDDDYQD